MQLLTHIFLSNMNPIDELKIFIEQHKIPGVAIPLITADDAVTFVNHCRNRNIKLAGFDGFHIIGQKVRIDQKLSPNYSEFTREEAVIKALDLLNQVKGSVGFEMIVNE